VGLVDDISFDDAVIGMLLIDADDLRILRANRSMCVVLGYTEEELCARTIVQITHPDDIPVRLGDVDRPPSGGIDGDQVERRYVRADGTVLRGALAVSLVRDERGRPHYYIGRFEDATARRRAAETLEHANVALRGFATAAKSAAAELERADREFEPVNAELARSNRHLAEFAAVASHDLRDPLSTISNSLELLARRYRGQLDDEANDLIVSAVQGANRLDNMVSALLAFAQVHRDNAQFGPVDTGALVEQVEQTLRRRVEIAGAVVSAGPMPTVIGDETLLRQLLQNLVGNALKFTSALQPVVRISAQDHPDEWRFSVVDNGMGLEPEDIERVFEAFRRVHNRSSSEGSGIGLALCRRIVEVHGGRIWAESEPGSGTAFHFTLSHDPMTHVTRDGEHQGERDPGERVQQRT
jgi:PAS domain S-box-containing protein